MDIRHQLGMMLVIDGVVIILAGLGLMFIDRVPMIGRLPGDINIHGRNWSFHFPLVSGIIISIILTVLINLFFRR